MVMVRVLPDGRKEEAELQASSSGFCVAKWAKGVEVHAASAEPDVVGNVDSDV